MMHLFLHACVSNVKRYRLWRLPHSDALVAWCFDGLRGLKY